MSKPDKRQDTHAPGHFANQGQPPRVTRKPDAEEQHQRRKDQAPRGNDVSGEDEKGGNAKGGDATGGRAKQKDHLREVLR